MASCHVLDASQQDRTCPRENLLTIVSKERPYDEPTSCGGTAHGVGNLWRDPRQIVPRLHKSASHADNESMRVSRQAAWFGSVGVDDVAQDLHHGALCSPWRACKCEHGIRWSAAQRCQQPRHCHDKVVVAATQK